MVLEVFSELENKIKKSIDIIIALKIEARQFKSQIDDLKKEIDNLLQLNNTLQNKNKELTEEHLFWKDKLLVLSKKINDFMLEDKY
ncbi:cell division protein ZapB [Buchnera aphidicola]|uniref:cell division protein ZapB n=1 Tax=Buchnera aphidicola TaxID=9 RepID=UPI00094C58C3|nr:cell division protein ZapB [Buchnera aphidicola]